MQKDQIQSTLFTIATPISAKPANAFKSMAKQTAAPTRAVAPTMMKMSKGDEFMKG